MSKFREIDGVKYPRVTSILGVIAKPALYGWYAKNGEKAYEMLRQAGQRGSNVHHAIESRHAGHSWDDIFKTSTKEESKYLLGYKKFEQEWDYKQIKKFDNKIVLSKKYHYCGELDEYGTLIYKKSKQEYKGILIDYKTSSGIWFEYPLQVSAYWHALLEMGEKVNFAGILRLTVTGNYELPFYDVHALVKYFKVFLAAKEIYNLQNENKENNNEK